MHTVTCILKCPRGHETSTRFFLIGIFWGKNYELFDISQVSYFCYKLGTKVNQCALVSIVSDYFWIFGAPRKFWPKRRRRQMMPRGWIFKTEITSMIKQHIGMLKMIFFQKSWGCYHVAVVQNWHSFGRFDRQLTGHKMDAREVLRLNKMVKCEPYVPYNPPRVVGPTGK